uniref:PH domain-containing protein n=1 Tax=Hymenolepis diminuta TaxID=6216 RepID=A0A0R3SLX2_HYMDI
LPLEGLKQRSNDTSFFTRHPSFSLFHSDPKVNIYKEFKSLDLSADSVNIRDDWKGALLRAGVFPEKSVQVVEEEKVRLVSSRPVRASFVSQQTIHLTIRPYYIAEDDLNQENNPILKRQVETIRNLVQSYMKI